jgi:hypothetical protein
VLDSGQAVPHGGENQIANRGATFCPEHLTVEPVCPGAVADDEAAKAGVTNQNVRTKPEHEMRYIDCPRERNRLCEIVRRRGIVQEICGTADAKRGVRSEQLALAEACEVEHSRRFSGESSERFAKACHSWLM